MNRFYSFFLAFMAVVCMMAAEPFTAFRVKGNVLLKSGNGQWMPLQQRMELRPADVLRITEGSEVFLMDNRTKCIYKIKTQGDAKVAKLAVDARRRASNVILSLTQQIKDIQTKNGKEKKWQQHGLTHGSTYRSVANLEKILETSSLERTTSLILQGVTNELSAAGMVADSVLVLNYVEQGEFCCFSLSNVGADTLFVNALRWEEMEQQTPVFQLCWPLGELEESVMRIAPGQTILMDAFLYASETLPDFGNIMLIGATEPFDAQSLLQQLQQACPDTITLSEEDRRKMHISLFRFF